MIHYPTPESHPMRSEAEVRQMIAELRQINHPYGSQTAVAIIVALENVLNGPIADTGLCGCMGPMGCCVCQIRRLACKPLVDTLVPLTPGSPTQSHAR